jgi:hypothetical protein
LKVYKVKVPEMTGDMLGKVVESSLNAQEFGEHFEHLEEIVAEDPVYYSVSHLVSHACLHLSEAIENPPLMGDNTIYTFNHWLLEF